LKCGPLWSVASDQDRIEPLVDKMLRKTLSDKSGAASNDDIVHKLKK